MKKLQAVSVRDVSKCLSQVKWDPRVVVNDILTDVPISYYPLRAIEAIKCNEYILAIRLLMIAIIKRGKV